MAQTDTLSSELDISSPLGGNLMTMLMADDIVPGSDPSYELCKIIYLYHPLGMKMASKPITMAQSLPRVRSVENAPDEVSEEFERVWRELGVTAVIRNTMRLARVYGIASLVIVVDGDDPNEPLDVKKLWDRSITFNVLDPLNTAGSLVLSQIPTSAAFNKPVTVSTMGTRYHPTRFMVALNEEPVYLAYTTSAFGFVGRSVYQRALFPLKSYVRSMVADDMIATKLGLLIAKQKKPGSIIDNVMQKMSNIKRGLLKQAQTGQVLSIDTEEDIATLDMVNVDGAGTYSRTNIIKNVATAADMPAKLLDNETLVSGFGEGTEDAKNIVRYLDEVRDTMEPLYAYMERVIQYRAWSPDFFARMRAEYPDLYARTTYEAALSDWRAGFHAEWPSLLMEPDSEKVKVEDTKLQSVIAFMQTLMPELDSENKEKVIAWAADNIGENKRLFPHALELDFDALGAFNKDQEERRRQVEDNAQQADQAAKQYQGELGGEARRFGRFE